MPDEVSIVLRDGELANLPGSADPGSEAKSLGRIARGVKSGLDLLDSFFRALLVLALAAELALVLTEIFSRFWFQQSLLWADEAAKLFLSLMAFVGGALAYRARHHTTVEFLSRKMPTRYKTAVAIGIDLLVLIAAAIVGYICLDLLAIAATSNTPILGINAAWMVLPLAIGLALVVIFALERLV
ncbi:MAG: TRAP-type transport system large permease protein, partial [Methylobacteriaceae bacterium]|nr:TRAP-type transport system large permease protein [Methylobacteriaceae bacterium]